MKKSLCLFLISIVSILLACGPVNKTKTASSEGDHSPAMGNGQTRLSKNGHFYVLTALAPVEGDTPFTLRYVSADTLHAPSADAVVSIEYWMPEMPGMGKLVTTATRSSDGVFSGVLTLSMAGTWQVTVSIQDSLSKNLVQDQYVFEVTF